MFFLLSLRNITCSLEGKYSDINTLRQFGKEKMNLKMSPIIQKITVAFQVLKEQTVLLHKSKYLSESLKIHAFKKLQHSEA